MNNIHLVATNACRWKYWRINLRLHHLNNADKRFQTIHKFEFLKSSNQIQYRNYNGDSDFNPANQQLLTDYYGDTENVITF